MAAKKRKSRAAGPGRSTRGRAGRAARDIDPEGRELLDMAQAIEMLRTTRPTFYRWLRAGKIKGMKVGRQWRFYREDVERRAERTYHPGS